MPKELYEELFELATELMVVLDRSGRVVHANPPFLELSGYRLEQVTGQTLSAFAHRDDQSRLAATLARLSADGLQSLGLRLMTCDGRMACCDFTLRSSTLGPYLLAVGHRHDSRGQQCNGGCTDSAVLERLVEERTRELQQANAEMESFSLSVSHDLRAPLRVIRGFAMAIAEEHMHELGPTGRDYLKRILFNCERMTTLTNYLLQLARMSRQALQLARVDLGTMADGIIADLRSVEPARKASFTVRGNMLVEGDGELLFTLLQNLLGNAWKYTAKRSRANIVFASEMVEGERVFAVIDNGVGYPLAQQERLFGLFQRLHDPDEYEGLGIGLPAARHIVQRHGGRIWSECITGEMTAFYFTLAPGRQLPLAGHLGQE